MCVRRNFLEIYDTIEINDLGRAEDLSTKNMKQE